VNKAFVCVNDYTIGAYDASAIEHIRIFTHHRHAQRPASDCNVDRGQLLL